jgi:hypothetical protein
MLSLSFCLSAFAEAPKGQTRFGEEGVARPARLPPEILSALVAENKEDLERCMEDHEVPARRIAVYFAAAPIDMNGDGLKDYVVTTGKYCLDGAHGRPFWIFLASPTGYKQIFPEPADARFPLDEFEIKPTSSKGVRDIVTMSFTADEAFYVLQRFDGVRYRSAKCWSEDPSTGKRLSSGCRHDD